MELLTGIFLSLFVTIVLFKALTNFISKRTKTRATPLIKLPPGPSPLPILGNLLQLGDQPHKSLSKLANIHGPLMTLRLGQITTVVISSAAIAKQILQTLDLNFSDRSRPQAIQAHDHHLVSVAWMPAGPSWRNLRKICNSYLFSVQRLGSNEDLRYRKIQELLAEVRENCLIGAALDIGKLAFKATLNVLSSNIFSLDLSDDSDSDFVNEFKEVVRCVMDEVGKPNVADYFPLLAKIDPQRSKHRNTVNIGRILDLFDRIIDRRLQLREAEDYVSTNDMLDTLLVLVEDDNSEMDRNSMKHLFLDLFAGGTDTTLSTLEWAMTELLRNPNALSKARAEIKQTIGKTSSLHESHIAQLPYLKAIIKETFRLHPPVPLLLPRKVGQNTETNGYMIPKDAQVLINVWHIGRDPTLWEDPGIFRPERFLKSNIDVKGQDFKLIPFGGGRRICPGLPLATRMLHLMLGSLVHSFDWKLEDGVTPENIDMEEKFGLTLEKAQPLRAIPIQV
ncbi:geraniol 8-hydroxylase-like [Mercurialis annua]|uniref:geraniol 8-hydroxylase-like n=1 Tax=Mercurialis annua TaxID=3986 RepID=UPI0024AD77E7|nr:geraniol 8-hydroxylase-like [Mercurialis annua]